MATVKALTGGTRDLNPQVLILPITTTGGTASGTFGAGVSRVQLPVPRYSAKNGRSIVMEVLGLEFIYNQLPQPQLVDGSSNIFGAMVTTSSGVPTSLAQVVQDTGCVDIDVQAYVVKVGAGLAPLLYTPNATYYEDLTDGAGHGILVASDAISFITFDNNNSGAVQTVQATAKLTYRFKEVSLTEYIGIVQSQQDRF